jgi:hypothetical protein
MGVRAIRFLGSVLATTCSVRSTNADRFFAVDVVRESALRTSACIGVQLHREMSRVNEVTDALSIDPSAGYILFFVIVHCFTVVYCLCK